MEDIWQGLRIETEGTGISRPLSRQINLLGSLLGHVARRQAGEEVFALVEELRMLAKRAIQSDSEALRDEAARRIATLSTEKITWLVRIYTAFFVLINLSEQQEIVRINRKRAKEAPNTPRAESIDEAIGMLKDAGCSFEQVCRAIERLDIQPTLTAHPTDARRRTIL